MEPIQFVLLGLATGGGYALAALGIVLIYRGAGVLNFAHGAIGMVSAFTYHELTQRAGLGPVAAVIAAVALGATLSGLVHLTVMRFLSNSAHLTRMVATLGLLIFIQELGQRRWGVVPSVVQPLLPTTTVSVAGARIGMDRVLVLLAAAVATAVLTAAYRRTRFGLATTAVAENEGSAALLGWSPQFIAMINWVVAGALAATAAILLAQLSTLTVEGASLAVLPALAAALVGRFSSFGGTLAGALGIGVCQALLARYSVVPGLAESVPLIVIILALSLRGRSVPSRGEARTREPRLGSGRSVIPVRALHTAAVVLAGLVLLMPSRYATGITLSAAYGLVLLSVVVLTGFTGQLSLAQFTLAGVGALVAGRLVGELGWPLLVGAAAGVIVTAILGAIIALPALRTRGMTLAMATLGLAVVLEQMVLGNFDLNGGFSGIAVSDISILGLDVSGIRQPRRFAVLAVLTLWAAMTLVANLRRGSTGRRLIAVRSNERSAAALGIGVRDTKLAAFVVAAGLAAAGGIIHGFHAGRVTPSGYSILESINVVTLAVIGGLGYVSGALAAALAAPGGLVQAFLHAVGNLGSWLHLVSGLGVVLIVVLVPDGLAKHNADQLAHLRRWFAGGEGAEPGSGRSSSARGPVAEVVPKALTARDLTVRFGGVTAVDGLDVHARPGEVTAIIGPNGAGKTSLLDAVSGFVPLAAGSVQLGSESVERRSPAERAALGLGRSFQSVELFDDLTVYDNLRTACDPRTPAGYLRDAIAPVDRGLSDAALAAVAEFDLHGVLDRSPRELPFGQRRLVGIARAVAREPSILLLDEPAAGLDDVETAELGDLIGRLARTWGMTVVLVEHDVGLVFRISDRVLVLDRGALIADGPPSVVAQDAAVVAAYLGEPTSGREIAGDGRGSASGAVSGQEVRP